MSDTAAVPVTFLFTDIEGSTRLWDEHPGAMRQLLLQHDDLLRACIESHSGRVFKTVGDAFCAVFPNPRGAVEAVLTSQSWLPALSLNTPGGARPLKVRMALHTGVVEERDGDYFGPPLNRVARLLAVGHGGQVLLSAAAQQALGGDLPRGAALQDRGSHRLRDISEPERVFQLLHPDLHADFPPLRSLSTHPNNLPQQLTSFIGREREIAELRGLMEKTRLLTLTGSGGCGKTRLALQVAAEVLEQFPDGARLVELAALSDPSLVPQTVASALGLKEERGKSLTETLTKSLKSKQLLLLLDNCEHLLEAAARLTDALLRASPGVRVLATSREGLGIVGELAFRVPSLSLPDPKFDTTPESVWKFEAARLFIERARLHQPQFAATTRNVAALASVCHRLDGIPLAIELAAARVRAMSVEQIEQRLDQRFRLLTDGSRTTLPRQQTLRSLIDWSYDLLNEVEKTLLCRLSVFAGGWTLEAAEHVCAGERVEQWEVLDLLTSLVDKSLVIYQEEHVTAHYRLLETVRQYAREKLAAEPGSASFRRQHRDYYVSLATMGRENLLGPEQGAWLERLDAEHDNLRAALGWCAQDEQSGAAGLQLSAALSQFWGTRGHFAEGREHYCAALGHAGAQEQTKERAQALNGAGLLAWRLADYEAARELYEDALSIRQERGDRSGIAGSLFNLGAVACAQGNYERAGGLFKQVLTISRELGSRDGQAITAFALNDLGDVSTAQGDDAAAQSHYEEALTTFRALGDRSGAAMTLSNLGIIARAQGDSATARACYEEALTTHRALGDKRSVANTLSNLGPLACDQGEAEAAREHLAECLRLCRAIGDRQVAVYGLGGMADLAQARGEHERAARLQGAAAALREAIGHPVRPVDVAEHERRIRKLRATLGAEAFVSAFTAGRSLTWEQAVAYALEESDG